MYWKCESNKENKPIQDQSLLQISLLISIKRPEKCLEKNVRIDIREVED